jgi:hypothetical protein
MQPDAKFREAVQYLLINLSHSGLPKKQWVQAVSSQVGVPLDDQFAKHPRIEFPGRQDAAKKFSTDGLERTLTGLVGRTSSGTVLNTNQSRAITLQIGTLHNLRRHMGSRKLSHVQKVLRAAHRRGAAASPIGPVTRQLSGKVEKVLASS